MTRSVTLRPPRPLVWGLKEAHSSPFAPTATSACDPTKTTWPRCKATPRPFKPASPAAEQATEGVLYQLIRFFLIPPYPIAARQPEFAKPLPRLHGAG